MGSSNGREVKGIRGIKRSIGIILIQIPFVDLNLQIDVEFLLLDDPNVPSLLSMRDMARNGLDVSLQKKLVTFAGKEQKLQMINYSIIHIWLPHEWPYALYTELELRKIHRNFGYPSVRATEGLPRRAAGANVYLEIRKPINKISEDCRICKLNSGATRRIKMTIGADKLCFKLSVQIDKMFLAGRDVLHMVNLETNFCAATFLKSKSAREM